MANLMDYMNGYYVHHDKGAYIDDLDLDNVWEASDHADNASTCNEGMTIKSVGLPQGSDCWGVSIDNRALNELVEKAVREVLGKNKEKPTPDIQKYKMKHK